MKQNRERILALDLLRGTFLVVIIVSHIAWSPSLFTFIGGGGQLFASAAEGFFVISGVLVGYLYGPKILKDTRSTFRKIWKRAALLYFLAAFFTFFYTAWVILEPDTQKHDTLYDKGGLKFLYNTLTMRYAFGWADFLTRYAVFMAVAPFVVWLIAKHKAWIVALVSLLIWFFFRQTELLLPFSAWQLVFMYGIIIGYYLPSIERWFRSLNRRYRYSVSSTLIVASAITYVLSVLLMVVAPIVLPVSSPINSLHDQLAVLFDKTHLAPARVAIGVAWFAALYVLCRRYERQINKYTYGVLELLGKQSLFVYCLHAFVLFVIDLYILPPPDSSILANSLVTIIVISLIYTCTYYRDYATHIRRRVTSNRSTTRVP